MLYRWLVSLVVSVGLTLSATAAACAAPAWNTPAKATWNAKPAQYAWTPHYDKPSSSVAIARSAWAVADTRNAALKWEIGYLALSAVDAGQTISCLHRHI